MTLPPGLPHYLFVGPCASILPVAIALHPSATLGHCIVHLDACKTSCVSPAAGGRLQSTRIQACLVDSSCPFRRQRHVHRRPRRGGGKLFRGSRTRRIAAVRHGGGRAAEPDAVRAELAGEAEERRLAQGVVRGVFGVRKDLGRGVLEDVPPARPGVDRVRRRDECKHGLESVGRIRVLWKTDAHPIRQDQVRCSGQAGRDVRGAEQRREDEETRRREGTSAKRTRGKGAAEEGRSRDRQRRTRKEEADGNGRSHRTAQHPVRAEPAGRNHRHDVGHAVPTVPRVQRSAHGAQQTRYSIRRVRSRHPSRRGHDRLARIQNHQHARHERVLRQKVMDRRDVGGPVSILSIE
mmetsp:Transcript_7284/g.25835  ORF Transcript_7284/g.25835 Transcript_7284/m.25835 type:complete len:350 (+) Transcript_7284:454-1503(+)